MPIAIVTESKFLAEIDGSHEVSVSVVVPHAVSEFVSSWRGRPLPHPQADIARSRIDIWVVHLGPTGTPDLVGLLDEVAADSELDVPKANYRWVAGFVFGSLWACCTVRD